MILTGVDRVYNLRMEVDESWVPADSTSKNPSPRMLSCARSSAELIGPGEEKS